MGKYLDIARRALDGGSTTQDTQKEREYETNEIDELSLPNGWKCDSDQIPANEKEDEADDPFEIPEHLRRDRFEPQDEVESAERDAIKTEPEFDDDTPPSKAACDIRGRFGEPSQEPRSNHD